jgi:hypothetical protein
MEKNKTQAGQRFDSENELTKIRRIKISELRFDNRNANTGSDLGEDLLRTSIVKFGAGRGILLDKDLNIIAGNHAVKELIVQGIEEIIIVPTDGNVLVATMRTDVELNSKQGREMALFDNRVAQANITLDPDLINDLVAEFDIDIDELALHVPAGEEMEDYEGGDGEGGTGSGEKKISSNLIPIDAALTKAQRELFDEYKDSNGLNSDTETVLHMLKQLAK